MGLSTYGSFPPKGTQFKEIRELYIELQSRKKLQCLSLDNLFFFSTQWKLLFPKVSAPLSLSLSKPIIKINLFSLMCKWLPNLNIFSHKSVYTDQDILILRMNFWLQNFKYQRVRRAGPLLDKEQLKSPSSGSLKANFSPCVSGHDLLSTYIGQHCANLFIYIVSFISTDTIIIFLTLLSFLFHRWKSC